MPIDFKTIMAGARRPEKSVPICLRGDLAADHEEAERQLREAQKRTADSLAGTGTGTIIARIEAIEAEMRENTQDFRLRALPKPVFRALVEAHPPRRDPETGDIIDSDRLILSNYDTLLPALVRACTIDPGLDENEWNELYDLLTDRQIGNLEDAAWFVNRGEVNVPFSQAASLMRRTSADE